MCCHSLKSSLNQGFKTRRNGCRKSCSGVNWFVSAQARAGWRCPVQTLCGQLISLYRHCLLQRQASVDWPKESTESITDWTKMMGGVRILPILNTEACWENTDLASLSDRSVTNSWLTFFSKENTKSYWCFSPKLPTVALDSSQKTSLLAVLFESLHICMNICIHTL